MDCFILQNQLSQRDVHKLHIHKNGRCTFLIDHLGAVLFDALKNEPRLRVISRPLIEAQEGINQLTDVNRIYPIPLVDDIELLEQNNALLVIKLIALES